MVDPTPAKISTILLTPFRMKTSRMPINTNPKAANWEAETSASSQIQAMRTAETGIAAMATPAAAAELLPMPQYQSRKLRMVGPPANQRMANH